jgi:mutator protein MutT
MMELSTTLVFLTQTDNLLLAMKKRGHGAGHWNGVGGKVEPTETIEQAMIRECQEEIGITPTQYTLVAEHMFYQQYQDKPCKIVVHVYTCTGWLGEPTESDEMTPKWHKIASIPYDQMWPQDRLWLPRVLAGEKLRGVFRYDNEDNPISSEITETASFA